MFYHISDIKKFLRCERIYFYSKDENNAFQPYLRSDESINDLLIDYLNIDSCFIGVKNDKTERFLSEVNNYDWFCHTRLSDGDLRINIPFLHKTDNGFDIYFVYYGTIIKELDLITYRISLKILEKYGIKVNEVYIIYLNGEYVNNGELNSKELFLTTNTFKDRNIKDIILEGDCDYENIISKIKDENIINNPAKKCKYCRQNGLCDYYVVCFPNEEKIEDDSVLTLVSSKNKNNMFEQGIKCLKDVDIEQIEGNRVQYAQIMASKNNGLFIDKPVLQNWLEKINCKPISFIDFEWDRYLIPPYVNMKPMDVLCFEFALYYIDEHGKMEHRTFVGTGDCRKEFIEGLIEYLPKDGPILAYNADGAEKMRLDELGVMFPEFKEELENIKNRFVDLAIPFIEGIVYDVRMKGNYTLKKLVDIVSDYSYSDLEIYDGMEAVYNWRNVDKGSDDEQQIIDNLKQYCSLDAYGLFLVYKWLIKLMVENK